jgi:hypothetical protein
VIFFQALRNTSLTLWKSVPSRSEGSTPAKW